MRLPSIWDDTMDVLTQMLPPAVGDYPTRIEVSPSEIMRSFSIGDFAGEFLVEVAIVKGSDLGGGGVVARLMLIRT